MTDQGFVVWLTGMSGAGKSTIAHGLADRLRKSRGARVEVLDGDVVRQNLWPELGFSRQDRDANIRRIIWLAKLLAGHGVVVIVAAISPYRALRGEARAELERFIEVHVDCELDELVRRDTKGLYARAQSGQVTQFTGVSDPYEPPLDPEVRLRTDLEPQEESVNQVLAAIDRLGYAERLALV